MRASNEFLSRFITWIRDTALVRIISWPLLSETRPPFIHKINMLLISKKVDDRLKRKTRKFFPEAPIGGKAQNWSFRLCSKRKFQLMWPAAR